MNRESMISIDWAKSRRNHRLSAEAAMRELKALYGNDESLFDQNPLVTIYTDEMVRNTAIHIMGLDDSVVSEQGSFEAILLHELEEIVQKSEIGDVGTKALKKHIDFSLERNAEELKGVSDARERRLEFVGVNLIRTEAVPDSHYLIEYPAEGNRRFEMQARTNEAFTLDPSLIEHAFPEQVFDGFPFELDFNGFQFMVDYDGSCYYYGSYEEEIGKGEQHENFVRVLTKLNECLVAMDQS